MAVCWRECSMAEVFTVRVPLELPRETIHAELERCIALWFANEEIEVSE